MTNSEIFERVCPYFMSIGVSYREFWFGDPQICKYALKAEKIRRERKNRDAWWQSLYMFKAMIDASPAFHDFGNGKNVELKFSTEEPFPLTQEDADRQEHDRELKKQQEIVNQAMNYMAAHNASFRAKKEKVTHDGK